MKSMRKKIIFPLSFLLLISLVLPLSHADNGTAEMSIVPEQQVVYFGETFTVDVLINVSNGTYGAACLITFDPSLIEVQNIEKGDLLVEDAFPFFSSFNNTEGTIKIEGFNFSLSLNQAFPMYYGVFATITFQAKDEVGISPLNFVIYVDGEPMTYFAEDIIPTVHNATVEIRKYPVIIEITP